MKNKLKNILTIYRLRNILLQRGEIMKTIQLDVVELRVLKELLWENPCSGGCAFEEMQNKKNIDCDDCIFTKAVNSIQEKLY